MGALCNICCNIMFYSVQLYEIEVTNQKTKA